MLCHPHNPVGRVWSTEELAEVADFARRHELTVCSDEIHCQLILDAERRHQPFASLSDDAAQRSITLMAPSKPITCPAWAALLPLSPTDFARAFGRAMRGIVPG